MNILVCISCVPDTVSKIDFIDNNTKFDSSNIQYIINPNDEIALAKAILLKEKEPSEITLLSVGYADICDSVLRKSLAIGADKMVRIDSESSDSYGVATQISEYAKQNNFDIIMMGKESIDYNGKCVPAMVSAILNLPFCNSCIDLNISNNKATATREMDDCTEIIEFDLPCVIASSKGLVLEKDIKLPNMRGMMNARRQEIEIVSFANIGSNILTKRFEKPQKKHQTKLLSKDDLDEFINVLQRDLKIM